MKKELKLLVLSLVISIFLISFVNAQCADNDRIMRLSPSIPVGNSHGALWDQAYTEEICYNDIFGSAYGGPNFHPAACSDPVLWLSAPTNSHASTIQTAIYDTPVCYGDLNCYVTAGVCLPGFQCVVKLSDISNAHIAKCTSTYPNKVCCGSNEFYWTDTMRNEIGGTTLIPADLGDTVFMVFEGAVAADDYDVREDDLVLDDNIRNGISSILIGDTSIAKWGISQADLAITPGDYDGFYFDVPGKLAEEPYLTVDPNINNNLPKTSIKSPVFDFKTLVNADISFEQESNDSDDELRIIWDFNDGSPVVFENCSKDIVTDVIDCASGNGDTIHAYNSNGVKTISLTAEEMTRNQKVERGTEVLIYSSGINVFAKINNPFPGETVDGRIVYVNASSVFVSECKTDSGECENLADSEYDGNVGIDDCYPVSDGVTTLYCYDLPKGGANGIGSKYELFFEWTFDGITEAAGNWTSNYTDVVEFFKFFDSAGRHELNLQVGYLPLP
jgi:hypothetical protein